jgi:A/G-specific adenine glycosylase
VPRASFGLALLEWYDRTKRDLPWRRTRDPYSIWISEIMLQQTRVAAALPFYERFLSRFPTIELLAGAIEADVLAHWAGLGYYSRARNLHKAARAVVAAGRGFPRDYDALLELPGIGDYTAAAIGSIAFDLPRAAVDGNLLRVLARLDNDPSDIGNARTRARFTKRAEELMDTRRPGEFNQGLMELGATICLPKSPRCGECPVRPYCAAYAAGRQRELPVKVRKLNKIDLNVTVLIIRNRNRILLRQRPADAGQMAGFWELPIAAEFPAAGVEDEIGKIRHTITHHNYLYRVHLASWSGRPPKPMAWKDLNLFDEILLTTAAKKALVCLSKLAGSTDRK